MVLFCECDTFDVFSSGVEIGASDVREVDTNLFLAVAIFAERLVVCLSGLSLDVVADIDFFFFPEELKIKKRITL